MKEDEMGGACSWHGNEEEDEQNFNQNTWRE
jgi:hypothetical protein